LKQKGEGPQLGSFSKEREMGQLSELSLGIILEVKEEG
jgi:hypothetical protein